MISCVRMRSRRRRARATSDPSRGLGGAGRELPGHKGKRRTVYTSLPATHYSTEAVARLYQERWEIELGFRDIKSSLPAQRRYATQQDSGA